MILILIIVLILWFYCLSTIEDAPPLPPKIGTKTVVSKTGLIVEIVDILNSTKVIAKSATGTSGDTFQLSIYSLEKLHE